MTYRLQNLMLAPFLAMMLALSTLLLGLGNLSQNLTSGGYQLFERVNYGIADDNSLTALGNFDYFAKIAPECCNAPNRTLTSSSGNFTPTHAADAGDILDARLPSRQTGQPTNGVVDVDGVEIHLQSGAQGPANRWYDPTKPAVNQTATHAEGHATALMVDNGITEMTITINNRLGPCGVCRNQIPDLLPQGSTLNVRWMDRNGVIQTTPIVGRAPTGQ